ncbi:Uncharacterized oxidoreductase YciK [Candidatus Providencia siddallii]|uniref:Uncharacterized oxidoreductase YciK n=1 Tax=Candidatus Providencia siddallii TaxID=1715285 RepID=A0A0M6W7Q9_9GAMM|nr:Uncharacterized oxidoreductase YciK [Candidatus Providencia siddallii]
MTKYQPKQNILNNKTILITGASSGIGREAAITYSYFGASIILIGRTKEKLNIVKSEIRKQTGRSSAIYILDLLTATKETYKLLVKNIKKEHQFLNGVLHNASILGEISLIKNQSSVTWHNVMQVNINGPFMLTQALLPFLLKTNNASLVYTSSSVGKKGRAGWGAYAVSKFATEGLMQILADEYKETNLRVNSINPGAVNTNMRANAFPLEDPLKLKTPTDIMPAYIYLMSDDSLGKTGISFDAQSDNFI